MNENGGTILRFNTEDALKRIFPPGVPGAKPMSGTTVYVSDLNEFRVFNGAEWQKISLGPHTLGHQPRLPGF